MAGSMILRSADGWVSEEWFECIPDEIGRSTGTFRPGFYCLNGIHAVSILKFDVCRDAVLVRLNWEVEH
jgi:hypothetical protein